MKKIIVLLALLSSVNLVSAQKNKNKKYPSLLWEITGKGLKKPSYLFGTMHVSSKMAFHLSDSFYHAIKSVDVVALETNPENWQDDFTNSKYTNLNPDQLRLRRYMDNNSGFDIPSDYLSINTFAVHKYEKSIARALSAKPEIINSLLYRNFAGAEDFEEDTFLDMYIFQTGKKLGKKVTGVENFEESQKLVMEAYRDAAKDKNTKRRSYDYNDNYADPNKLQEAYRKGDLDLLDSINKLNVFSDAFQEKFLYRRNDIQASSIDSIIKSGSSLFVGVGAAHLPGTRGVIEWLRKHGYTLRPVTMGERDSNQKDAIDKVRIPLSFNTRWADDSSFSVELPGKLYRFMPMQYLNQVQFADMTNGAYYMVTRLKTNSTMLGQNLNTVYQKVDSMLYENVPGKIISRKDITVNGYKGFDITNKTRRGDYQRYNIIITPFEIFFFKMSGNNEYVINGDEANKFFASIKIKEYQSDKWVNYTPPYGGFTVKMPTTPVMNKVFSGGPDRLEFESVDEKDGSDYLIMKSDVQNINFIEEDTFDLNLIDESFASSIIIDKTLSRKLGTYKRYPSLDVKYKHKDGSITQARYLIQGPHYYALFAHAKTEQPTHQTFFNSFSITPFIYPEVKDRTDTSLYFTVKSPVYPEQNNEAKAWMENLLRDYQESNDSYNDILSSTKTITIGNDTAGEKVMVMYYKLPKYTYMKDSSLFWDKGTLAVHDSDFIYRKLEKKNLPNGFVNYNLQMLDTNSSRMINARLFYKEGVLHMIATLTDTLTPPSSLLTNFFETFKPADTIKGYSPFVRKSNLFFTDYYSADSATKKKALRNLSTMYFDSTDVPQIKKAISQLTWKDKDYLNVKKQWIEHLGNMGDTSVSYYLEDLYKTAGDTVELQNIVLESLMKQRTKTSYRLFKDIMLEEPPVIEKGEYERNELSFDHITFGVPSREDFYRNRDMFVSLYDSVELTKTLFPEMLALVTLDDYKPMIMQLLANMVDSGYVKASGYQEYYNKFWLEAKQLQRKQSIAEKSKAIEKKQDELDETKSVSVRRNDDEGDSKGNEALDLYAVLLMPFWDKNENVPAFYDKLLQSGDKKLKYNTALLLLRNKKPVPDTMWKYFAAMDEYRSGLYNDLEEINQLNKFPAQYKSQADMAKAVLIESRDYNKADTIVYLDKISAAYKKDKGWIYFYKYKDKKDDAVWEFASSGLQPENVKEISTDDDFTSFMQDNVDEDKPVKEQIQKLVKQMLNSRRKSARNFYSSGYGYNSLFGGDVSASTDEE
ncbi:MAG: TraB/GumN family protein [Sphingobacteriales bacterium]|nr:TraB/GumN family protein [Sphingobacteriales bacterium]